MLIMRITALGIFLTTSSWALADPTTLVCDEKGTDQFYTYDGQITVDLDETQRTATMHYPGITFHIPVGHAEAHSIGPLVGTFTPDNITIGVPPQTITINRITGEAVIRTEDGRATETPRRTFSQSNCRDQQHGLSLRDLCSLA